MLQETPHSLVLGPAVAGREQAPSHVEAPSLADRRMRSLPVPRRRTVEVRHVSRPVPARLRHGCIPAPYPRPGECGRWRLARLAMEAGSMTSLSRMAG